MLWDAGFAVTDLSGDGIPELLIGSLGSGGAGGFGGIVGSAAGGQGEGHGQGQHQSDDLLHNLFPFLPAVAPAGGENEKRTALPKRSRKNGNKVPIFPDSAPQRM